MKQINDRYGILLNDDEWDLLYRSVTFRKDNIEDITGFEPEDLKQLAEDLLAVKEKGYMKTTDNMVTEEEALDRICKNCD